MPSTQTKVIALGSLVALGDIWACFQSDQACSPEQLEPGLESGFSHGPLALET